MLASAIRDVKALEPRRFEGRVTALEGLRIEAAGPAEAMRLGASVRFGDLEGPRGELVGFEGDRAIILACDPLEGLGLGAPVLFTSGLDMVRPSDSWLGRVIDAFAEPLDGLGPLRSGWRPRAVRATAPNAQARARVQDKLALGVKAMRGRAEAGSVRGIGRRQIHLDVDAGARGRSRRDCHWPDRRTRPRGA
jgi:flagellum-specific ATP synthase